MIAKAWDTCPRTLTDTPGTATVDDLFRGVEELRNTHAHVDGIWMSKKRALSFGAVGFIAGALPPMLVTDMPDDEIGFQGSDYDNKGATVWLLMVI